MLCVDRSGIYISTLFCSIHYYVGGGFIWFYETQICLVEYVAEVSLVLNLNCISLGGETTSGDSITSNYVEYSQYALSFSGVSVSHFVGECVGMLIIMRMRGKIPCEWQWLTCKHGGSVAWFCCYRV